MSNSLPQRRFMDLLRAQWNRERFLCVGLDPDLKKIPVSIAEDPMTRMERFLQAIVTATAGVAAAFKPNLAFFLQHGSEGVAMLEWLCHYIIDKHPEVVLIVDGKCGDIGNTNDGYAEFFFECCKADAITVHPYLGAESLKPFLARDDKGIFVLCHTSNPGADEFQQQEIFCREKDGKGLMDLYQFVAQHVTRDWNGKENCGLVTGATYPAEIKEVRKIAPNLPLLIPGIGKQGGDLEKAVRAARTQEGGFLINCSSAISSPPDGPGTFEQRSAAAAAQYHDDIRRAWASKS
jgi:orotidine-5'-phosphate decarboxylase